MYLDFKKINYFIFLIIILFFGGCTTLRHSVQVSSYTSDVPVGNRYFIQAAEEKRKDKSLELQLKEFEKYLDLTLAKKGFVKVKNIKNADQFIVYNYNISEPRTYTYSYDEPVWDTVLRPHTRYRKIDGRYYPYTHWEHDYEMVGYRTRVRTKTIFTKDLQLTSFDRNKSKSFWQVNASMSDTSGDLRYSIPFMARGLENYIGINSGQVINIEIPEDDVEVQLLRKGVIESSAVMQGQ